MKSFSKWINEDENYRVRDILDPQYGEKAYNAGASNMRESLRCASCIHFYVEKDEDSPEYLGCLANRCSPKSRDFGCRFHEERKVGE